MTDGSIDSFFSLQQGQGREVRTLLRRLREVAERGTKQVPAPAGDGERHFKHTPGNRERVGLGKSEAWGPSASSSLGQRLKQQLPPRGMRTRRAGECLTGRTAVR